MATVVVWRARACEGARAGVRGLRFVDEEADGLAPRDLEPEGAVAHGLLGLLDLLHAVDLPHHVLAQRLQVARVRLTLCICTYLLYICMEGVYQTKI